MTHSYKYPRPAVTVDLVVVGNSPTGQRVLLIERGGETFNGYYALPGGFLEVSDDEGQGESLEAAACRELLEETGVKVGFDQLVQLGAFGTPGRDPRGRVISVAYLAGLSVMQSARAGDDASAAEWVPLEQAGKMVLAFDHNEILAAGIARLSEGTY